MLQLTGAKEAAVLALAEGVLELAGAKEHAVLVLADRMLQLTGAKDKAVLALTLAKSPQECQRLHCVLIVTGI